MDSIIMESINFEFLRERWPELASLGGFAEQYVASDPASAMVKLRSFVESMIQRLYEEKGFSKPLTTSLHDLMTTPAFKAAIPLVVTQRFPLLTQSWKSIGPWRKRLGFRSKRTPEGRI